MLEYIRIIVPLKICIVLVFTGKLRFRVAGCLLQPIAHATLVCT